MLGLALQMESHREVDGSDSKGRWTWVQLTGKQGKAISVITTYRVSQTYPSEASYSTVFMQQYRPYIKKMFQIQSQSTESYWISPYSPLIGGVTTLIPVSL